MTDNLDDEMHCGNCLGTRDPDTGEHNDDSEECYHCECCCECMACIYAPQDSVGLTDEQRASIAALDLKAKP